MGFKAAQSHHLEPPLVSAWALMGQRGGKPGVGFPRGRWPGLGAGERRPCGPGWGGAGRGRGRAGRGGARQAEAGGGARRAARQALAAGLRLAGLRRRRGCGTGRAAPWRRRCLMLRRFLPRRPRRLRRQSQRLGTRIIARSECCRVCGARSVSGGWADGTHPAAAAAAGLRGRRACGGGGAEPRRGRGAERGPGRGPEPTRGRTSSAGRAGTGEAGRGVCWGRCRLDGAAWAGLPLLGGSGEPGICPEGAAWAAPA